MTMKKKTQCKDCTWARRCAWLQGEAYGAEDTCEKFQAGRPMRIKEGRQDLPHDADRLFLDIT